jgi:hypothetical protein
MGNSDSPVFEARPFMGVTDYKVINSGTAVFKLIDVQSGEILVTTAETNIQPGRIYTLVAKGRRNQSATATNNLGLQLIRNYPNY